MQIKITIECYLATVRMNAIEKDNIIKNLCCSSKVSVIEIFVISMTSLTIGISLGF